jgi:DNA-binding transcriptional MerR regulator
MAAPKKLFKVGEIMRHTKLSRQTVHNYTMLGLIKPAERTESGHRLYGEEVFDRIKKIELLKLHHTLDEVRTMLLAEDEKKSEPAA